MAGVLASVDAAATSIGFPIRNMHTISESAHTGDILAAIHALEATLRRMDAQGYSADDFRRLPPETRSGDPGLPRTVNLSTRNRISIDLHHSHPRYVQWNQRG